MNFDERYLKMDRTKAEIMGQPVYFDSSKECKRGHNTWRYTNNGRCVLCARRSAGIRKSKEEQGDFFNRQADARRKAEALREQRELEKSLDVFA